MPIIIIYIMLQPSLPPFIFQDTHTRTQKKNHYLELTLQKKNIEKEETKYYPTIEGLFTSRHTPKIPNKRNRLFFSSLSHDESILIVHSIFMPCVEKKKIVLFSFCNTQKKRNQNQEHDHSFNTVDPSYHPFRSSLYRRRHHGHNNH